MALADEVLEPAGAGDDDVDAAADRRDLRALADATEDGARGEAEALRERRHRLLDLGDELAGRGEDERARPARLRPLAARREAGEQGQHEGDGLAGAGAAAAEHVATRERVGQRRGLDGGGGRDAAGGEHLDEGGGHAERAEVLGGQGGSFVVHGVVADRRGRRRLGCSAGRGSGPRRRVAGTCPDAKASTSKKSRPEAEGGPLRPVYGTPLSTPHRAERRCGTTRRNRLRADRAGPPTVTYAVAAALPARHPAAARRPPAAAAVRAAIPRAGAHPRRARRGRPAVRGHAHPQGSRGRARRGAGPARHRLRGPGRRDGAGREAPAARWCTWSPPGCDGSASTASTTRPAPRSPPGVVTWLPDPPVGDDPEVAALAERALRAHTAYLVGLGAEARAGRGAAVRRRLPGRGADGARPGRPAAGARGRRMPRPGCAPCWRCCGARRPSSAGSGPCRPRPTRAAPR